ncbi:MAG: signal peptidase I [Pseudomonadota bacterium]
MAAAAKSKKGGGIGEVISILVQALLLALVIRTVLYQPFSIPSGSMKPTLLISDYLFVSKFSYGYSRHSFPFGLVPFDGRIWSGEPERGDVAVFKYPRDNRTDYIKRVIGLPGDRIQVREGLIYINDVPIERERIEDFIDPGAINAPVHQYIETLPNGVSYNVLDLVDNSIGDNTQVFEVPDGHYFMMGDNRDNSQDSRALNRVGYVPFENLIGRADVIWFSFDRNAELPMWMRSCVNNAEPGTEACVPSQSQILQIWTWPWTIRWERLFDGVG